MLTELACIVQEIRQIPHVSEALKRLVELIQQTVKVDCCSVFLAEHDKQCFVLKATVGLSETAVGRLTVKFDEGLVGLVGRREEPLNLRDARAHPQFKECPQIDESLYHGFLATPIMHRRKVIGVLTVQQRQQRVFDKEEEAFLLTLSAQLAEEILQACTVGEVLRQSSDSTQEVPVIKGIPVSNGLVIGIGNVHASHASLRQQALVYAEEPSVELRQFKRAVRSTRHDISALSRRIKGTVPEDVQAIFLWYQQLLDADSLGQEVETKISQGWSAASALKIVVEQYILQFNKMQDKYMRERVVDVEDLGNRVLSHILDKSSTRQNLPNSGVLVAKEVTASMLADYPRDKLVAVVSQKGTRNSHTAILARAMNIPAVMGMGNLPLSLLEQTPLIVDGYSGELVIRPDANLLSHYQKLIDEETLQYEQMVAETQGNAQSRDGIPVELLLNTGLVEELESNEHHTDMGVGLFRTEIPFMMRNSFPSEKEQETLYRTVLKTYAPHSVTMRTLDIGGDKPLPYFPISEENPFLGWRGIRLTLDRPDIFLLQVRGMLMANVGLDNLKILLPMISSVSEVHESRRLIQQAVDELSEELQQVVPMPQIGIMLEVPSVLYQLADLANIVDFFSVGSNDLTQYMLAVDRNNARVSELCDCMHPAVLKALHFIVKKANSYQRPVTLCGEMASEPEGAVLLWAMGYRKFSVSAPQMRKIKWVLSRVETRQSEQLLARVLQFTDIHSVKQEVAKFIESLGVGGLLRAGR